MPGTKISQKLIGAATRLAEAVGSLRFAAPVSHLYNPLLYAWSAHELYLRRFGATRKRVVLVGMNPGPFGMVQTGVPFGEVRAVKDWMGIEAPIRQPERMHPRRPIEGFNCLRSEISGQRLWGLFAARFGPAEKFFADHLVVNYCPLAFLEPSGRNRTPAQLPAAEAAPLFRICDDHLARVLEILQPQWVIGIGGFAGERVRSLTLGKRIRSGQVLHPSPASPAANRDWAGTVATQLQRLGVWK
jgi:single-strand selective monofunctional uracil DNA glycosylase